MRSWCAAAAVALILAADISAGTLSRSSRRRGSQQSATLFRGEEALARVYDFILEARFDQVDAELRRACGPAPAEACDVLAATALWWRILLDPENRTLDEEFSASVERAIRATEAWAERAPQ